MNIRRRSPAEHLPVEIVTDHDIVETAYKKTELDLRLHEYAFFGLGSHTNQLPEEHLRSTISSYAQVLTPFAVTAEELNTGFVRVAHKRLIDGVNKVSNEKLGYKPPKNLSDLVLQKTGLRRPALNEDYSNNNDAYWQQFEVDFENQRVIRRKPNETTSEYATRYLSEQFWRHPGAAFTYLPQAYRRA